MEKSSELLFNVERKKLNAFAFSPLKCSSKFINYYYYCIFIFQIKNKFTYFLKLFSVFSFFCFHLWNIYQLIKILFYFIQNNNKRLNERQKKISENVILYVLVIEGILKMLMFLFSFLCRSWRFLLAIRILKMTLRSTYLKFSAFICTIY